MSRDFQGIEEILRGRLIWDFNLQALWTMVASNPMSKSSV